MSYQTCGRPVLIHRRQIFDHKGTRAISRDKLSGIPPEEFVPERFITGSQLTDAIDPYSYAFGFARRWVTIPMSGSLPIDHYFKTTRECPGRYLAENSLFLIISWLMATVSVCKAKNAEGVEEFVEPTYITALIR